MTLLLHPLSKWPSLPHADPFTANFTESPLRVTYNWLSLIPESMHMQRITEAIWKTRFAEFNQGLLHNATT